MYFAHMWENIYTSSCRLSAWMQLSGGARSFMQHHITSRKLQLKRCRNHQVLILHCCSAESLFPAFSHLHKSEPLLRFCSFSMHGTVYHLVLFPSSTHHQTDFLFQSFLMCHNVNSTQKVILHQNVHS